MPTIVLGHLSAAKARAFMIADKNRLAEGAAWKQRGFCAEQLDGAVAGPRPDFGDRDDRGSSRRGSTCQLARGLRGARKRRSPAALSPAGSTWMTRLAIISRVLGRIGGHVRGGSRAASERLGAFPIFSITTKVVGGPNLVWKLPIPSASDCRAVFYAALLGVKRRAMLAWNSLRTASRHPGFWR